MCGIYAAVSSTPILKELIQGLDHLSYRGYDSAGVAIFEGDKIERRRAKGKLSCLSEVLKDKPVEGYIGIAHTRWATHGLPNEINAHPHMTSKVAVVHNGIIENYPRLQNRLEQAGYHFESDTDSETIPLLITFFLDQGCQPSAALRKAIAELEGSFALVAIFNEQPGVLFAARQGSPLVLGQANDGFFISSDENALSEKINASCHLKDGDIARINESALEVLNFYGDKMNRSLTLHHKSQSQACKNGYNHFMLKEIFEQSLVFNFTLNHYIREIDQGDNAELFIKPISNLNNSITRLTIVACGTSYYAGMVAKYWIENHSGLPVDLDIASEYRYKDLPITQKSAALFISQSGETADTLAAMQHAKAQGQLCFSLVNVTNSTMAKESDVILPTMAGQEVGVASTKAFTTQLAVLATLSIAIAKNNGLITQQDASDALKNLRSAEKLIETVLKTSDHIRHIATELAHANNAIYMGRGSAYPIALEGALKLKEISYIHAEAYPAGELKHGPIALVDKKMPVIVVAPSNKLFSKTLSNLREVASRGAKIILLSDKEGIEQSKHFIQHSIEVPKSSHLIEPIIYNIPLQLLAYHVAVARGTDVDQPRNLAKSVTVE